MSRVNIYLPDDLAAEAKAAGLNISGLAQEAIRSALIASRLDNWRTTVSSLPATGIDHESVLVAVAGAKDDLEGE